MKILLPILIFVFTFPAFGQVRKPAPKPKIRPLGVNKGTNPRVVKSNPSVKVAVEKNDGLRIVGLFVSGDTEKITVKSSGGDVAIKLSEIKSLNFGGDLIINKMSSVDFDSGPIFNPNADASTLRLGDPNKSGLSRTSEVNERNFDSASNQPTTIRGGVLNGNALSLPKPSYPPAALTVRATGAVSVQVLIDETGNVISAEAVSGHPLLRAACVKSAFEAKFKPTVLSGNPIKVSGIIVYNFVP